MVTYRDYVAGWLDSSIHDFLRTIPSHADSIRYALITCLDSNLDPGSLLRQSAGLRSVESEVVPLGNGLVLPTKLLVRVNSDNQLFFGFDEVCFFHEEPHQPKPDSVWLVGPARIDQPKLDRLGAWMAESSCSLALGDGEGLNFIMKARGLVKHLLGHSIAQPPPQVTFLTSPAGAVAG